MKWGQPSYLTPETKSGSTFRIDQVKPVPRAYAVYFHCQTNLVETFRELYPESCAMKATAPSFWARKNTVPGGALRHCVALALTYHLGNR